MGNPGTNPEAHPPRVRGSRRGLGRAACAGLVVLACTFAVAGQAQQTHDIDNLDDAVDRLALELVHEGKLEGKKVLVSPRYFFERWNERSLRLSAHLAAKFASALGSRNVEVVSGSEESGVMTLRGEWTIERGSENLHLYVEVKKLEIEKRQDGGEVSERKVVAPKDRRVRLGSIDEEYLKPDLASHGLNAVRKLEKGIRDNLSSMTGRYRVHIGSFKGTNTTQPERVRQRLIRQLGPAFVHSRKLTRVHSADKAAGELHGEVYDSGDSIELGLYIVDNERKEEVAAANFEISKALLRDIFPLRGEVAGSGDKDDEALPPPPPPPLAEVTMLLERCASYERAHSLTMPSGANAADCYSKVLERDPGNAQAQAGMDSIRVLYAKRVQGMMDRSAFDEARGVVERLKKMQRKHPWVETLEARIGTAQAQRLVETAEAAIDRGAFDEARDMVEQLRGLSPEHPWVWESEEKIRTAQAQRLVEQAEAAIGRGAFDEARGVVEQLRRLSPEHPWVWESEARIRTAQAQHLVEKTEAAIRRGELAKARGHVERRIAELTPEMVRIEGGYFRMGSPGSERGRRDDERQHEVYVDAFSIATHEVTFAEYDRFVEAAGQSRPEDEGWGRGQRPVINVSWDDATAYARWLSGETGRRYRLPTEAEWEYAARAGSTTEYPWGNRVGHGRANCEGCGSRWDDRQTAPVGSFEANMWGVHDTVGNVWEWTCSAYDEGYGGAESGCASGSGGRRVIRGGSWYDDPRWVRSALRGWGDTDTRLNYLGFRLAQD